jgi:hypothetical protein
MLFFNGYDENQVALSANKSLPESVEPGVINGTGARDEVRSVFPIYGMSGSFTSGAGR